MNYAADVLWPELGRKVKVVLEDLTLRVIDTENGDVPAIDTFTGVASKEEAEAILRNRAVYGDVEWYSYEPTLYQSTPEELAGRMRDQQNSGGGSE